MKIRSLLSCLILLLAAFLIVELFHTSWFSHAKVQADTSASTSREQAYFELGKRNGPLFEGSDHLTKVARVATPCVVHILSERRTRRGPVEETGSGVIMTSSVAEGFYVVTNRHVLLDAQMNDITISLADGRDVHPVRVWQDQATDLAVMKLDVTGLDAARWGDSDQIEIGHMVLAMGSPFGLSQSVTLGIISAKGRRSLELGPESEVLNQNFLQTDAAINPGNSGGPLIDLHGRVVGINTAIASSSGGNEGIGFSIPSNLAKRVMRQLLQYGQVRRAYLGVKLDPEFDLITARTKGLNRQIGARVTLVYPNTPAARARLLFDDIILRFNGREVEDQKDLINQVSLTPVGSQIELEVLRNRRVVRLEVTLVEREAVQQSKLSNENPQRTPLPSIQPMSRSAKATFSRTSSTIRSAASIEEISLVPLNKSLRRQLHLDETVKGLLVMKLPQQISLANEVQLYDLIQEVAGEQVTSAADFVEHWNQYAKGGSVLLKIRRRHSSTSELIEVN